MPRSLLFTNQYFTTIERFILLLCPSVYFVLMQSITFLQYDCFSYDLDLAWYANLISFGEGKWPLYSTIHDSWLGDHFEPISMLFLPFYAIFQNSLFLLILQNLIFTLQPLLLATLTYQICRNSSAALIVALLSWLNPMHWFVNSYNFHWVVMALPLITLAFIFFERGRLGFSWIFLLAVLLCKENMALIVAPCLLFFAWRSKAYLKNFTVLLLVSLWFYGLNAWLLPKLGSVPILSRWGTWGNSFAEIFLNILLHPIAFSSSLFNHQSGLYAIDLALAFGGSWLFSLKSLMALPIGMLYFSASDWAKRTIQFQNCIEIAAILQIAAVYGWCNLQNICAKLKQGRIAFLGISIAALCLSLWNSQWYFWHKGDPIQKHVQLLHDLSTYLYQPARYCPQKPQLESLMTLIPTDRKTKIIVKSSLAFRLARYPHLAIFDYGPFYRHNYYQDFDFVIGGLKTGFSSNENELKLFLENLLRQPHWQLIYRDDENFVLKNIISVRP